MGRVQFRAIVMMSGDEDYDADHVEKYLRVTATCGFRPPAVPGRGGVISAPRGGVTCTSPSLCRLITAWQANGFRTCGARKLSSPVPGYRRLRLVVDYEVAGSDRDVLNEVRGTEAIGERVRGPKGR